MAPAVLLLTPDGAGKPEDPTGATVLDGTFRFVVITEEDTAEEVVMTVVLRAGQFVTVSAQLVIVISSVLQ
jgi:hypothetical protein